MYAGCRNKHLKPDIKAIQKLAPLSPYIAVMVGLFVYKSAWLAVLIYQLLALFVVLMCRPQVKMQCSKSVALWVCSLVFGLAGLILVIGAPWLMDGGLLTERLLSVGLNSHNIVWFCVWFSLLNPVLEELLWRGLLYTPRMAPSIQDVTFGGYHAIVMMNLLSWPWACLVFVVCVTAGWLWRLLRLYSDGLVLPILAHTLSDASIMAAVWWLCYGKQPL